MMMPRLPIALERRLAAHPATERLPDLDWGTEYRGRYPNGTNGPGTLMAHAVAVGSEALLDQLSQWLSTAQNPMLFEAAVTGALRRGRHEMLQRLSTPSLNAARQQWQTDLGDLTDGLISQRLRVLRDAGQAGVAPEAIRLTLERLRTLWLPADAPALRQIFFDRAVFYQCVRHAPAVAQEWVETGLGLLKTSWSGLFSCALREQEGGLAHALWTQRPPTRNASEQWAQAEHALKELHQSLLTHPSPHHSEALALTAQGLAHQMTAAGLDADPWDAAMAWCSPCAEALGSDFMAWVQAQAPVPGPLELTALCFAPASAHGQQRVDAWLTSASSTQVRGLQPHLTQAIQARMEQFIRQRQNAGEAHTEVARIGWTILAQMQRHGLLSPEFSPIPEYDTLKGPWRESMTRYWQAAALSQHMNEPAPRAPRSRPRL